VAGAVLARRRLRIATCLAFPEPDLDEAPLLAALSRAGIEPLLLPWDDPAADWDSPVPTLIRSTWNYHLAPEAFLRWVERAARAAPLFNAVDVVRWNAHKSYLADLERRGVPIVPTAFVERGARASLAQVAGARGFDEVVVKPAVSAGSYRTRRFDRRALAGQGEEHLRALLAERDVLVQRYLPSVEQYGERCLVWVDGALTHAVRKQPRFADDAEATAAVEIAADERALAGRALAAAPPGLLYGRVDMARDERGDLVLMELELIEPSLFFAKGDGALDRLVRALATRLG